MVQHLLPLVLAYKVQSLKKQKYTVVRCPYRTRSSYTDSCEGPGELVQIPVGIYVHFQEPVFHLTLGIFVSLRRKKFSLANHKSSRKTHQSSLGDGFSRNHHQIESKKEFFPNLHAFNQSVFYSIIATPVTYCCTFVPNGIPISRERRAISLVEIIVRFDPRMLVGSRWSDIHGFCGQPCTVVESSDDYFSTISFHDL